MARAIHNFEITLQNPYRKQIARDEAPSKVDATFWRLFSRIPRAVSYSQKQKAEKTEQSQPRNQQERLIVISSFKNTESTEASPPPKYNFRNNPVRRFISDDDIELIQKFIKKENHQSQRDQVGDIIQKNTGNLSQSLVKGRGTDLGKRINLSGSSQVKSRPIVSKQLAKKRTVPPICDSQLKLPELKEQKRYPVLQRDPEQLKHIKAQSYILVQNPSQRVIVSQHQNMSLEIASLTKIMTFYVIVQLAVERKIDLSVQIIIVSPEVYNISGTSAQLNDGEQYTVQQMLYRLMLPSGNDAANQLAYWANSFLTEANDYKAKLKVFVAQMNRQAKKLDMKNSHFANAHGLPHQEAKSTAADMAKLCCACLKNELFRKVVQADSFRMQVKSNGHSRLVEWSNTNKLLRREGFSGLKTGITVTAGPCLAALYTFRGQEYISVLLRAPKISARFKQTRLLIHWAMCKLHKNLSEGQKASLKKLRKHDAQLDSDNSEDEREFRYDCKNAGEYKKRCHILDEEL